MALNCRVHDCIYNEDGGKCFATSIMIGSRNARTSSETTCNSYVSGNQIKNYEFANEFIEGEKVPSDTNNIKCAAMNCRFNNNQDCFATKVEINKENANCETFEP